MRANILAGSTQDSAVLYDAMNREYAPTQSRWISPDPAGLASVDPTNPQTWNSYAYVTNNPVSLTDPLGLDGDNPSEFEPSDPPPVGPLGCYYGIPCSPCDFIICAPEGGGGGSGPHYGAGGPAPSSGPQHGPWPGNQTPGLPQLPIQPLSLGDLLSLTPGIGDGFQSDATYPTAGAICAANAPECAIAILVLGSAYAAYEIFQHTKAQTQATPNATTNNSQPCVPPSGTQCYETQSGHSHNGWDPHSHIWTRNQVPSTGKCYWNRGGGTRGTTQFPPAGMQSCSTYPTWPNN